MSLLALSKGLFWYAVLAIIVYCQSQHQTHINTLGHIGIAIASKANSTEFLFLMCCSSAWPHAMYLWAQAAQLWSAVTLHCRSGWQTQCWVAVHMHMLVEFTLCSVGCAVSMLSDGFSFTSHTHISCKHGQCTLSQHSCSKKLSLATLPRLPHP